MTSSTLRGTLSGSVERHQLTIARERSSMPMTVNDPPARRSGTPVEINSS